jgi:hypothetical protein
MVREYFSYVALAALGFAAIFSSFPLWKSATLSPDSIQRRVWWTACAVAAASLFLSQLPDWSSGLFMAIMLGIALFFVAGFWTNFIKINGRVYSAFQSNRPDRPPALEDRADDE